MKNKSKIKKLERKSPNGFISRIPMIYELAVVNYVPFQEALEVYVQSFLKVYKNKKNYVSGYDQKIEDEAFNLSDRYFAIERSKKIKELKKLEELEKITNL